MAASGPAGPSVWDGGPPVCRHPSCLLGPSNLRHWAGPAWVDCRHLLTPYQWAAVIKSFVQGLVFGSVSPLPDSVVACLRRSIGDFLWQGFLEWLPTQSCILLLRGQPLTLHYPDWQDGLPLPGGVGGGLSATCGILDWPLPKTYIPALGGWRSSCWEHPPAYRDLSISLI